MNNTSRFWVCIFSAVALSLLLGSCSDKNENVPENLQAAQSGQTANNTTAKKEVYSENFLKIKAANEATEELQQKNAFGAITYSAELLHGCELSSSDYKSENTYLELVDFFKNSSEDTLPEGFADENQVPRLLPVSGFIQGFDNGRKVYYTATGKKLPEGSEFTFLCDPQKNPVFVYNGLLCKYVEGIGFTETSYDDILGNRGAFLGYNFMVDSYNSNIALVYRDGLYGYKRTNSNNNLIAPSFPDAYYFSEGYGIALDKDGAIHVFDSDGKKVLNGKQKKLYFGTEGCVFKQGYGYFSHGYTRASKDGVQVLINPKGDIFPLPKDYNLVAYSCGMIMLEKNGKYGFMNTKGSWVIDPYYEYAEPFSEGLAVVAELNKETFSDYRYAMLDTDGKVVFPHVFDGITSCSGGAITLYRKELGWFVVNKVEYIFHEQ